jgi:hypothetical protein
LTPSSATIRAPQKISSSASVRSTGPESSGASVTLVAIFAPVRCAIARASRSWSRLVTTIHARPPRRSIASTSAASSDNGSTARLPSGISMKYELKKRLRSGCQIDHIETPGTIVRCMRRDLRKPEQAASLRIRTQRR